MNCITTTIREHSRAAELLARNLATCLQIPYIERNNLGLATLRMRFDLDNIIVATKTHPVLFTPQGQYFFHLNMAELRIKNLINGNPDHMSVAMALKPNMSVLDCTLGLATYAIVASYIVGRQGRVVGLESSVLVATITSWGLQHFSGVGIDPAIITALRRITVHHTNCLSFLKKLPDNSFDIVYLDPMFRQPIVGSANLKPLREIANNTPLNATIIFEACRVATVRVVVKEGHGSPEFARLGISFLVGGKYSSVQYGVIETGGRACND